MTRKQDAEIAALLTSLWESNLPLLRERLDILDVIAAQAACGELTENSQAQALDIAHKLSGSLGMFGFPEGTKIAQQMEQLLRSSTTTKMNHLRDLTFELRQIVLKE